ncbi:hypothetical protein Hanom_Chr05g00441401 [Helianthus anomalus]
MIQYGHNQHTSHMKQDGSRDQFCQLSTMNASQDCQKTLYWLEKTVHESSRTSCSLRLASGSPLQPPGSLSTQFLHLCLPPFPPCAFASSSVFTY